MQEEGSEKEAMEPKGTRPAAIPGGDKITLQFSANYAIEDSLRELSLLQIRDVKLRQNRCFWKKSKGLFLKFSVEFFLQKFVNMR